MADTCDAFFTYLESYKGLDSDAQLVVTAILISNSSQNSTFPIDDWFTKAAALVNELAEGGIFVQCHYVNLGAGDVSFASKFTALSLDSQRAVAVSDGGFF